MTETIILSTEEYDKLKQQLTALSQEKTRLLCALNERVKELNCLYKISRLVETPGITLEEILQQAVNLIPAAWQCPETTCARLIFKNREFRTDNFNDADLKQLADIKINRKSVGSIEVCLLGKKFRDGEEPFSKEEIALLETIAEQLGKTIERMRAEASLREAAEEWQSTFDSISDLVFIQNNDHVILKANKAFCDALKSRPKDVIGKKCYELLHKSNSPWPNCPAEKTKSDRTTHTEEVDSENLGIPLLVTTSPVFNNKGELAGSVHIAKDITERKKEEEALALKNALLVIQQETSIDGILVVNSKGKIISSNKRFTDIWNIPPETVESHPVESVFQAVLNQVADPAQFLAKIPYLYENYQEKSRDEIILIDGRILDCYSAPMLGPKGRCYGRVWYFRDITERKQLEKKLIELTIMDELTGLNNRRGFSILAAKQIKKADRHKHGLTLIYIDLDNMKWINDNLGHKEGDRALIDLSTILKKSFRSSDIIARLGGDEFAGLVTDHQGKTSETILARMKKSMDSLNSQKIRPYNLSISFGVIRYDPENPCSLDKLLEHADKAMYSHKHEKGIRRGVKTAQ